MGDNITQWSRRASRTSPDRSDFAKLGETIALEQTKQFADDIRSQVAERVVN